MKVCNDLRERQFTTNSTTGKRCRYIDEWDELDTGKVVWSGQGPLDYTIEKEYQNGKDRVAVPSDRVLEVER